MKPAEQASLLLEAMQSLSIYNIFAAGPGQKIADLVNKNTTAAPPYGEVAAGLFRELTAWAETSGLPTVGSLWQNFILDQIILADNSFSRQAATAFPPPGGLPGLVYDAAGKDLAGLRFILDFDLSALFAGPQNNLYLELARKSLDSAPDGLPAASPAYNIGRLKKRLLGNKEWSSPDVLGSFHHQSGCGAFCRYHAFRWDGEQKKLLGIEHPDPVRLEKLIGYEDQRNQIMQNTERLLEGLPAGNILLYGDRGTGKSSTVKALIHRYGPRGLRMLEIPRDQLADYQRILREIGGTGLKFIIYVDDLSYEEGETNYKVLKSLLEGSLQPKPENVVIYATSNRRHLVREFFEDRQGDVNSNDTLQEKLSLSERFAITVLFLSPDQELFISIVEGLARQNGLDIPPADLRIRALEWERWNNGRSGRTARQFIESLIGNGDTPAED